MKKFDHELVVCIVNSGSSDAVMDAAREVGARGGTVITAKGTANKEEMVLILVPNKIKEDVLHALYRAVGLNTPGQGIAFALPVDNVLGLTTDNAPKPEETPAAEQSEEQ